MTECHLDGEDIRHDLLGDLLARLRSFDPGRSPLRPFVMMCSEHRSTLIMRAALRERAASHSVELDAPNFTGSAVCVIDTLDENQGYGA